MDPATTPGNASGRMTFRNVSAGFAPKSLEASIKDFGTRSSAVWIGKIIYGSQIYTKTRNTPVIETASEGPPNNFELKYQFSRPSRCSRRANQETIPSWARMSFHE